MDSKSEDDSGGDEASETDEGSTKASESDRGTTEVQSEDEASTSHGTLLLPKVNAKDSEEERKTSHHKFVQAKDELFGAWHDKRIAQGETKWED